MALNTNLLAQTPDLAGSFVQGRQEARQNKLAEMQMMQQQQQFAQQQQQFAQQQQDYEQANAMNKYLQGANLNTPEGMAGLNQFGLKGVTTGATLAKNKAEMNAAQNKSQLDRLGIMEKATDQAGSLYFAVQKNPAAWPQARQQLVTMMGQFGGDPNSIPEQYDPKFVALEMQKALKVKDALTDQRARETQQITMRGQNMVDDRAKAGQQRVAETAANRLAQDKQGLTYQTDVNGNIVALPTSMRNGVMPTPIPMTGATGAPIKAQLSPYAEKTKTETAIRAKEISSTIQELQAAVAPGGLIERSTGSGAGALINAAAGFVGQSTKGAEAAAALAPIYDKVLKTVPRFEGPQSDKDTASYNKAAGDFANPAIPKERKLVAAKEILRLLQKSVPETGAKPVNLPSGWSVEVN